MTPYLYNLMNVKLRRTAILILLGGLYQLPSFAQNGLRPGFDAAEYKELLGIFAQQNDTDLYERDHASLEYPALPDTGRSFHIPFPRHSRFVYRSPESGLYNRWDLWLRDDSTGVICIRGTIDNSASWLENFYAAMVPATGTLQLNDSTTFHYRLAADSSAAVHAGWLVGMASLAPTIIGQIRHAYQSGIRRFIIMGHSQGGAIAFLLRSYLYYLPDSILPKDIRYKTYCSAAPKPGNLQYAYDFDYITRGGWAFRVVNTQDWVPENPFSVQTLQDINKANPFGNVGAALRKQPLPVRLYMKHVFNRLDKSTRKAAKQLRKYLGHVAFKQVQKLLPQMKEPAYVRSFDYMPAGIPVVLPPYPGYDEDFPFNGRNVFIHHGLRPYYRLVQRDYPAEGR